MHDVPPHVRHHRVGGEPLHVTRQQAQPRHVALVGVLVQQLHADANSEHRPLSIDEVPDHTLEPGVPQLPETGLEVADPRHD
jgi:hypothetical protein